jgi:hypothetical protein
MKKYITHEMACLLGVVAILSAVIGFAGGIICTLKIFPTMAGAGTALGAIAWHFMEG